MKKSSKKLDFDHQHYTSKSKTGVNIFAQRTKNNETFIHRKRNLWDENSNLRKDKEKLLDENDDLFDENNKLKNEKYNLLDENDQLRNDLDKKNEKLSRKNEKYEALKKKNKVLHGENKNLREENENLSRQNNYMRNLFSCFGILFDEDGKQISNNTGNQQMLNPFIFPWIISDEANLSKSRNKLADNQKQEPMPKISFSQLQK